MSLSKINRHVEQAQDRLPSQFRNKERILSLIEALVEQDQDLEQALCDVMELRSLELAFGAQLDGIGKIVDEARRGQSDDDYRIAIKAKIGQNISKGVGEDLIYVFNLLTGTPVSQILEIYPAELAIFATSDVSSLNMNRILVFCQKVVSAGVRIIYVGSYPGLADSFAFAGPSLGKGFGTLTDPNVGGKFASLAATGY